MGSEQCPEVGLGLVAMKERARMLGGLLHLWSEQGKGTRIALSIPIAKGEL
jgi:signal transduction histidine kinase